MTLAAEIIPRAMHMQIAVVAIPACISESLIAASSVINLGIAQHVPVLVPREKRDFTVQ
ncbi:MAG: hypothetical protein P8O15_10560 [Luminiphilus sp.]|nr:hypothetical protein [Luminiphilus sp.]